MLLFVEILPEPLGLFIVGVALVATAVGLRTVLGKHEAGKGDKTPETHGR